jgi:transcriptional regulator
MHPNAAFRSEDRAQLEALIDAVGFGMVFLTTPDGPRVAHVPLLSTGTGALRFHLARGHALTRHLAGANAMAVVNGPDGYISARWYSEPDQVPTWNYIALEMEGPVRRLDRAELLALLEDATAHHEARITHGTPWTMAKMDRNKRDRMLDMIVGFELEVTAWRPTFKLSQNKPAGERMCVVDGLKAQGTHAIAALMEQLAP